MVSFQRLDLLVPDARSSLPERIAVPGSRPRTRACPLEVCGRSTLGSLATTHSSDTGCCHHSARSDHVVLGVPVTSSAKYPSVHCIRSPQGCTLGVQDEQSDRSARSPRVQMGGSAPASGMCGYKAPLHTCSSLTSERCRTACL